MHLVGGIVPVNEASTSSTAASAGWQQVLRGVHGRRAVIVFFFVVTLLAGMYTVGIKGSERSAFNRWQPQLIELSEGTDIYLRYAFPTPPIMAMILLPFASLPAPWGMIAWTLLKAVLATLCFAAALVLAESSGPPTRSEEAEDATRSVHATPAWILLFAAVMALRPIVGDMTHGNVNIWILGLVVATWWAFRWQHDWAAGLLVSLAACCKVTPLLLVVYFAWKRQFRVLGFAMVGFILWLVVVPGLWFGMSRNEHLLVHWADQMVAPFLIEHAVDTEQINQSMPGLVHRLTTDSMAIKPDDGRPIIKLNWVDWPPQHAQWLVLGIAALLVAGGASVCRASAQYRSDIRLAHELGIVLLLMLLLSERSWKHHYVTLLPSLMVLCVTANRAGWRSGLGKTIWGCLGFALIAMSLTSTDFARPFMGAEGAKYAQGYGAYVWAALALAIGHVAAIRRINRDLQPQAEPHRPEFAELCGP